MTIFFFVTGLVLLIAGAEALVRGASRLATAIGISPLVVGLTVVAFGTSSPELSVSIKSALSDQSSIAIGNVIGSNIFNVLFILGLSALIVPLKVSQQLIRLDVPLMIATSVLILFLGYDGRVNRFEGIVLFSCLIVYTLFLIYESQREKKQVQNEYTQEHVSNNNPTTKQWLTDITLILSGLGLLIFGSRWFVDSAIKIAKYLGVSELIIGLTIVAAGTSLPEVVTSVIAAIKGERDIAVGNVVGSNILNILGVLGLSAIVAAHGLEVSQAVLHFDIPVMIAVATACLPVFFTGYLIARWEGALFLGYYVAYTLYLVLASTQHESLALFNTTMLYFVIPLTAITLTIVTIRTLRIKKRPE